MSGPDVPAQPPQPAQPPPEAEAAAPAPPRADPAAGLAESAAANGAGDPAAIGEEPLSEPDSGPEDAPEPQPQRGPAALHAVLGDAPSAEDVFELVKRQEYLQRQVTQLHRQQIIVLGLLSIVLWRTRKLGLPTDAG